MEKKEKRKICGLIVRLMAGEAREINLKNQKRINWGYSKSSREVGPKEIKKELTDFLKGSSIHISTKAVQDYALRYLREHEAIATANPSYRILRERIERGEYDFSFVKNSESRP
jgi:hypothetical protein